MTTTTPTAGTRRTLRFDSFEDLLAEVDRLQSAGYARLGNWSLGQICEHLQLTMDIALHGKPFAWALRATLGRVILKKLTRRQMPAGIKALKRTQPADGLNDADGVARLKARIAEAQADPRPVILHPFFGKVDKATWTLTQLVHAEHHLGFLLPK